MAKANKVYTRVSVSFLLTKEELERLPSKWVVLNDLNGNEITSSDLSTDNYEDEDGNECEENGEYLN